MSLGTLKKIDDLRRIWKNEERDFSAWLSRPENMHLLGEAIGVDILLEEREAPVGAYSVDIFAKEDITNKPIIIENQLDDTNHDHLGKVITYAAGKGAGIMIWIVKHARDEHISAIDWLNEHTDNEIAFFLVEIQLWQIDDSNYAPQFNVVAKPNEWESNSKAVSGMSELRQTQLAFWQGFKDYAQGSPLAHEFTLRKAQGQHWYDLGIGNKYAYITLTVDSQKKVITAGIWVSDNKSLFETYAEQKPSIEGVIGLPMQWVNKAEKKAAYTRVSQPFDIKKTEKWEDAYSWYADLCLKLKKAFAGIEEK